MLANWVLLEKRDGEKSCTIAPASFLGVNPSKITEHGVEVTSQRGLSGSGTSHHSASSIPPLSLISSHRIPGETQMSYTYPH